MKIAVISDTHDNEINTRTALDIIRGQGVDTIYHCGDMTKSPMCDLFTDFCIHHVRGNNDFNELGIQIGLQSCRPGSTTSYVYTDLVDEKRIAVMHGHDYGMYRTLIENGKLDYIFHGHTHRQGDERDGDTRVINPGAIGGARRGRRGFCIVNFATDEVEWFNPFDEE